jgi:predicted ATPase
VVLDGAEHLVPDLGPVVGDLAAAGGDVSVLVTSRRPLGVAGEAVVPVRPLDSCTAEELFLERARAALPDWVADAAESAAVSEICRLDGLPLAVELAAGRLRALSAAAIAERLERGLGVLGRGGALEASIDASHALLTKDEQELFRRLSVFAGPFRLEDAEHVGVVVEPVPAVGESHAVGQLGGIECGRHGCSLFRDRGGRGGTARPRPGGRRWSGTRRRRRAGGRRQRA